MNTTVMMTPRMNVLQHDDDSKTKDAESVAINSVPKVNSDPKEEGTLPVLREVSEALQFLNKIAMLDSTVYHCALAGGGDDESNDIVGLQESLDCIIERLRLHNEGLRIGHVVESLARSILRFHSNLYTLKAESDQQTADILQKMEEIHELEVRNQEMAAGLYKLHDKKKRMSAKLRNSVKLEHSLISHIESSARRIETLEEQQKEMQLRAHEHVLMSSSTGKRDRADTDNTVPNTTAPESLSAYDSDRDDTLGCDVHSSAGSVPASSVPKRFSEPTVRWASSTADAPVTLNFVVGPEVGMRFRALSAVEQSKKTATTPTQPRSRGSLTEAFLECDKSDVESILRKEVDCPVEASAERRASSFLDRFSMDSFLGKQQQPDEERETVLEKTSSSAETSDRNVFVISGYTDAFDKAGHKIKPMIGSRIVAINGENVPETWTLRDLNERLRSVTSSTRKEDVASDSGCQVETFSITFRTDPLKVEPEQVKGKRSKSFSFWSPNNSPRSVQSDTEQPDDEPTELETESAGMSPSEVAREPLERAQSEKGMPSKSFYFWPVNTSPPQIVQTGRERTDDDDEPTQLSKLIQQGSTQVESSAKVTRKN